MDEITFVHTGDIHLGQKAGYLGSKSDARKSEVFITFRKIIDHCAKNATPLLIIAGDLFESNGVDDYFIEQSFNLFSLIPDTTVVFCAGNHDPLSSDSPFLRDNLPQNVIVLPAKPAKIYIEKLNACIYGCSFSNVYESALPQITAEDNTHFNIMVLHGDLDAVNSPYRPISKEFLRESNMHYVALGHIHKKSDICFAGNTAYAYCGCPDGQGFDESGEKGFYEITLSKTDIKHRFISVASRKHIVCEINISNINDNAQIAQYVLDNLKAQYGENYTDNLYKIVLIGSTDEKFMLKTDEILSIISPYVYFAKIKNRTKTKADYLSVAKEKTLKGVFVKNMLEKISNAQDNNQRALLENALEIGFHAFEGEVAYNED